MYLFLNPLVDHLFQDFEPLLVGEADAWRMDVAMTFVIYNYGEGVFVKVCTDDSP